MSVYTVTTKSPVWDAVIEDLAKTGGILVEKTNVANPEKNISVRESFENWGSRITKEEADRMMSEINRSRDEDWD